MKYKIQFEGDYCEDFAELRGFVAIKDMLMAISEAQELVRSRLKYGQDLTDSEIRILDQIQSALYIKSLD